MRTKTSIRPVRRPVRSAIASAKPLAALGGAARTIVRGLDTVVVAKSSSSDKAKVLLQSLSEAWDMSRQAGEPVSVRVDVSPDGTARIAAPEIAATPPVRVQVEAIERPSPELAKALAAARERGRIHAAEILARDDMLSADDFAALLGTTRVTVNAKRQSGQALGLDGAKRGYRFPAWQVDRNGKLYPELADLHQRLGDPWAVYRLLVQRHAALDGLTGRQALERSKGAALLDIAEGIARGDFN